MKHNNDNYYAFVLLMTTRATMRAVKVGPRPHVTAEGPSPGPGPDLDPDPVDGTTPAATPPEHTLEL